MKIKLIMCTLSFLIIFTMQLSAMGRNNGMRFSMAKSSVPRLHLCTSNPSAKSFKPDFDAQLPRTAYQQMARLVIKSTLEIGKGLDLEYIQSFCAVCIKNRSSSLRKSVDRREQVCHMVRKLKEDKMGKEETHKTIKSFKERIFKDSNKMLCNYIKMFDPYVVCAILHFRNTHSGTRFHWAFAFANKALVDRRLERILKSYYLLPLSEFSGDREIAGVYGPKEIGKPQDFEKSYWHELEKLSTKEWDTRRDMVPQEYRDGMIIEEAGKLAQTIQENYLPFLNSQKK